MKGGVAPLPIPIEIILLVYSFETILPLGSSNTPRKVEYMIIFWNYTLGFHCATQNSSWEREGHHRVAKKTQKFKQ